MTYVWTVVVVTEVAKKDVKEGRADVKFVTATKARNQSAQEVSSLHHTYPGGMKPDDLLPHKVDSLKNDNKNIKSLIIIIKY